MKKVSELQKMTAVELNSELDALLREQFNMRMQQSTGQLTRPHLIKQVRKNIARVKTILMEKGKIGDSHD